MFPCFSSAAFGSWMKETRTQAQLGIVRKLALKRGVKCWERNTEMRKGGGELIVKLNSYDSTSLSAFPSTFPVAKQNKANKQNYQV